MKTGGVTQCTPSSEFSPPHCRQLSSARTYSLLRSDPPSRSPSTRLSLLGYASSTFRAFAGRRLRDFPQSPTRSVPSILTLITSMSLAGHIPFVLSCKVSVCTLRFPRFYGGSPNIAATSGSPIVPGWTLPADLSDSASRRTPCQSTSFGGSDLYFGYGTSKGKATEWI